MANPSEATAWELAKVAGLPREQKIVELSKQIIKGVLAEPAHLPPLPTLARLHSQQVFGHSAKGSRWSEGGANESLQRLRQWEKWHSLVAEVLVLDGVDLLAECGKRHWWEPFRALSDRLEEYIRALTALKLPWWQTWHIEPETFRELSVVDYAAKVLGAWNSYAIRSGAYSSRAQPKRIAPTARARRDVDDPEWGPQEPLL